MTGHEPREQETIYESLKANLENKIASLTNFTPNSFNYVWTQAFSEEVRELELDNTAANLEGLVDYAGGDVSESDLRRLGIEDTASEDEINERLEEANLDELVKIVGVDRDEGERATGTVTFTTQSGQTDIPEETSVATEPDAQGDFIEFETTEDAETLDGETEVDVSIEAVDVGERFNVGGGTLTHLPDPPPGVQASSNSESTSGGVDRETNDELRERAKQAIFQSSGGGTAQGLAGYIDSNVDNVTDVEVEEFFSGDSWHGSYPHGHVIVDGGDRQSILNAIDESRPVSVQHVLVRPDIFNIQADVDLRGDDIDETAVADSIEVYLNGLEISDDVIYNKIIQNTLNADDNIVDIDTLDLSVDNETLSFDEETVDDFEDNDISVTNRHWGDWSGDTANFSAQDATTISDSYSGELSSANENVSVSTTRTSAVTESFEVKTQIDTQTGNASDIVSYAFESGGTALGSLEFRGNGNIVWSGSSNTTIDTWSAGSAVTATMQWDFDSDDVDITAGNTETDLGLTNPASDWDKVTITNDTTASTSTVNAYIDDIYTLTDTYSLSLGDEMVSDGITSVEGTAGGSSTTFTEDTDYQEVNVGGSEDSIQWILSGTRPDTTERQTTIEFNSNRDTYFVDDALLEEGVSSVEDSTGTTYDEGTDWQETDTTNDGRDDAIEWLDGGSTPDDGTDFTITYNAGTSFFIDYDIADDDITVGDSEKANAGPINITVL